MIYYNYLAVIFMIAVVVSGTPMKFINEFTCVDKGQKVCNDWNNQTSIVKTINKFSSFPGDTLVYSTEGIKKMEDLRIGDFILSFNVEKNQEEFSEVLDWMFKMPKVKADFQELRFNQNFTLICSKFHNVAIEMTEQIKFKFVDQLRKGDLIVGKGQSVKFEQTSTKQSVGLYAPYTKNENFFVLLQSDLQQRKPAILIHSLSQLKNPQNHKLHSKMIELTNYFKTIGDKGDQEHILSSHLSFMFGEDWQKHEMDVKIAVKLPSDHNRKGRLTQDSGSSDDRSDDVRRIMMLHELYRVMTNLIL